MSSIVVSNKYSLWRFIIGFVSHKNGVAYILMRQQECSLPGAYIRAHTHRCFISVVLLSCCLVKIKVWVSYYQFLELKLDTKIGLSHPPMVHKCPPLSTREGQKLEKWSNKFAFLDLFLLRYEQKIPEVSIWYSRFSPTGFCLENMTRPLKSQKSTLVWNTRYGCLSRELWRVSWR